MEEHPDNRDPHGAAAEFLEQRRRRKRRRHKPHLQVIDAQSSAQRPRVPLVIPDHKCALCGADPLSGMTFPGSAVVYFCDAHINIGRRISEKAWEYRKRQRLMEEYIEAKRQQLDGALEREMSRRRCPFCQNELSQEYTEDGKLVEFCPVCDTEFYDAGGAAEDESDSSGFGIIGEAEGFDGPGPADDL